MPYRRNKRRRKAEKVTEPLPPTKVTVPSLVLIPQEDVNGVWPLVEPFISAAAERGEYSSELLWSWATSGEAQLWMAWSDHCEAAAVTTRLPGDICLIAALGGKESGRWMPLLSDLEAWAKQQGCIAMRAWARKGWARKLKDYEMSRVILDKKL
jgi:hypothetical protein